MSPTGRNASMLALSVGALGVVFGDIGTSPLYALHAAFTGQHRAVAPTEAAVYGLISLVFWTLTLVVSIKYVTFIMRADNEGEGGIMALLALVRAAARSSAAAKAVLIALGLFGASLFYGDGTITPAISVLSAVEGLDVAAPGLSSLVVPIALVVLVALFAIQRYGTGAVGALFGPVMGVWFVVLALSGLRQVVDHPAIAKALSPSYGVAFLAGHGDVAFVALGSVVLTVTGAEALYADMGHFGRPPIRRAWFLLVFPALVLNYMGQGALILDSPAEIRNPFFLLFPGWARIPTVVLATAATVIASQAVISGVFSLTHQAVQLRFLPRLTIRHTSTRTAGQVYLPAVNWALCVAVAVLVIAFGSSARLAGAYGIAVTGTMTITTVLFFFVVRGVWRKPLWLAAAGAATFLTVDLTLFSASLTKLPSGGWLPVASAVAVFTLFSTWRSGAAILRRNLAREEGPLAAFVHDVRTREPPAYRVPGTAVFLHATRDTTPLALRANLEHNHVLHRSVVIVLVKTLNVSHVDIADRVVADDLGYRDDGIVHVTVHFGYRDRQNVPETLAVAAARGVEGTVDVAGASYFLSRITVVPTDAPGMRSWRKRLFVVMWRNEADPAGYFAVPDERAVTMGSIIEL